MKFKIVSVTVVTGLLLLFTSAGICQERISASELVEKIGQGAVNWSAGYIEAVGIGAPPDKTIGKANARPIALRAAKVDAYRNLLEITRGVRVDSTTTVKDFTIESDIVNTQVDGLVKDGVVVDQQYMSDGTVEVKIRIPLYDSYNDAVLFIASGNQVGVKVRMPIYNNHVNLAMVVIPAAIEKRKALKLPETPPAPAMVRETPATPPMVYTGLVVDARGIAARPAMSPRILDEDGKEVYSSANVDREFAAQQGLSGYARDLTAAQTNQRVTNSPITVKALKTDGGGKTDIVISKADARILRASAEHVSFLKKCRVMIVLD